MFDSFKIANYMKDHIGETASTRRIMKQSGTFDGDFNKLSMDDWMKFDEEVNDVAKWYGYILDKSHHENSLEGLPWNLDFVIRKRSLNKYLDIEDFKVTACDLDRRVQVKVYNEGVSDVLNDLEVRSPDEFNNKYEYNYYLFGVYETACRMDNGISAAFTFEED